MIAISLSPFIRYNPRMPRRALDPREVSVCRNVDVEGGSLARSNGFITMGLGLSEPAYHSAEHVTNDGTRYLCIHTKSMFYVYNTSTSVLTDYTRSGDAYSLSTRSWTSTSFGDIYIFTNGIDEVQQWDGGASPLVAATDLSGLTTERPRNVLTFGAHLLLSGFNDEITPVEGKAVVWSVPGTCTDFSGAGSGKMYIYEGRGSVTNIVTFTRDTIVAYKTDSIHLIEYVAAPSYFVNRSAITGVGLDSLHGVAKLENTHLVLTNSGIREFDGVSIKPFKPEIDTVLRQYYPNANSYYARLVYDVYNQKLWVFLPNNGDNWYSSTALCYAFKNDSWSVQDGFSTYTACTSIIYDTPPTTWDGTSPLTWADMASLNWLWNAHRSESQYSLIVFDAINAGYSGYFEDETGSTRIGNTFLGTVETAIFNPGFILFQHPITKTEIVQVDVGDATAATQIFIGVSENGDENITWYGPYTPNDNGIVYTTIVGRWFILRVQGGGLFNITSLTTWFVKRGVV